MTKPLPTDIARSLDGARVAKQRLSQLSSQVHLSLDQGRRLPGLTFILVGNDPSSALYVRMKQRRCREVGFQSSIIALNDSVSLPQLIKTIESCNHNPDVDGILVQQPLPPHLPLQKVVASVDPAKDVDGFHPLNLGRLLVGDREGFIPCTPLGITELLKAYKISTQSKEVVILGRSLIVGTPLALLLSHKAYGFNATVTLAHSYSQNLNDLCRRADILVAAVGSAHIVKQEMVKPGATVIDVGINQLTGGGIVGDVDAAQVRRKASFLTPVPGGVGPMTIAMLLTNTWKSYAQKS